MATYYYQVYYNDSYVSVTDSYSSASSVPYHTTRTKSETSSRTGSETWSVNFNANGGDGAGWSTSVTAKYSVPTKRDLATWGYAIYNAPDLKGTRKDSGSVAANHIIRPGSSEYGQVGTTTKYAASMNFWENTWGSWYDNGSQTYTSIGSVTTPSSAAAGSRTGYAFGGWSYNNTIYGTGVNVTPTSNNATFYAVWIQQQYTYSLAYNANGGTGAPATQTYGPTTDISHSFTVPSPAPTWTGHTFNGYGWVQSDSTVNYRIGETVPLYTSNTSRTLYAKWTELPKYTLTYIKQVYDEPGTTVYGSVPSAKTEYSGTTITLGDPANAYITGSYSKNITLTLNLNGGIYGTGQTSLTNLVNQPCRYYATKWVIGSTYYSSGASYKITSNVNAYLDNFDTRVVPQEDLVSTTFVLGTPSKTNYIFEGWYYDSSFTNKVSNNSVTTKVNTQVYAKFIPEYRYILEYRDVDESVLFRDVYPELGTVTETFHDFTVRQGVSKYGYNFSTWVEQSTRTPHAPGTVIRVTGGQTRDAILVLYASYSIKSWTITYRAIETSWSDTDTVSFSDAYYVRTTKPTFDNYLFRGWKYSLDNEEIYSSKGGEKIKSANEEFTNLVITADLVGIKRLYFNLNGGTCTNPACEGTKYIYADNSYNYKIPDCKPTKPGYRFLGWGLTESGGANYFGNETYSFASLQSPIHLYAIYEPDKYHINISKVPISADAAILVNGAPYSLLNKYDYGTPIRITVDIPWTPEGRLYELDHFTLNGNIRTGDELSFVISTNNNVEVYFTKKPSLTIGVSYPNIFSESSLSLPNVRVFANGEFKALINEQGVYRKITGLSKGDLITLELSTAGSDNVYFERWDGSEVQLDRSNSFIITDDITLLATFKEYRKFYVSVYPTVLTVKFNGVELFPNEVQKVKETDRINIVATSNSDEIYVDKMYYYSIDGPLIEKIGGDVLISPTTLYKSSNLFASKITIATKDLADSAKITLNIAVNNDAYIPISGSGISFRVDAKEPGKEPYKLQNSKFNDNSYGKFTFDVNYGDSVIFSFYKPFLKSDSLYIKSITERVGSNSYNLPIPAEGEFNTFIVSSLEGSATLTFNISEKKDIPPEQGSIEILPTVGGFNMVNTSFVAALGEEYGYENSQNTGMSWTEFTDTYGDGFYDFLGNDGKLGGQCTWYAKGRSAQVRNNKYAGAPNGDGINNYPGMGGNAWTWSSTGLGGNWTTTPTPSLGDVVVLGKTTTNSAGHVGVVESIDTADGEITVKYSHFNAISGGEYTLTMNKPGSIKYDANTGNIISPTNRSVEFITNSANPFVESPKYLFSNTETQKVSNYGYVTGGGSTFKDGDTVTMTAVANFGYEFCYWLDKDFETILSKEPTIFVTASDRTAGIYTAIFTVAHVSSGQRPDGDTDNPDNFPDDEMAQVYSVTAYFYIDSFDECSDVWNYKFNKWLLGGDRYAYRLLSHIRPNENYSWIDTGCVASPLTKWEITGSFNELNKLQRMGLSSINGNFRLTVTQSNMLCLDLNDDTRIELLTVNKDTEYNIVIDAPGSVQVNYNGTSIRKEFSPFNRISSATIKLFSDDVYYNSMYEEGIYAPPHTFDFKLSSCKIYFGYELFRDFVPVKRLQDGNIGLWDKVNCKFYENSNDYTQKFIPGKESTELLNKFE